VNDAIVTAGGPGASMKGAPRPAWPDVFASPLGFALVAYLALALILLPGYMSFYYKDEIAYVAAAERYARGEFSTAPNALWGPLISWLMALALSLGAPSIVAARSVAIIIGGATLWSVRRLAKTLELPDGLQLVYLLTLVPYLVRYALFGATDDLPLTALLVAYFAIVFDPRYPDRRYSGAICGLLGGFAYYAKGFALGFFLVHFTICNAVHWIARSDAGTRKEIVRQLGTGLVVFAAMAAVWMAALYQKYHVITPGITGKYNYEMRAPGTIDRPATQIGFVAPPPATTVSIWEDPADFYDLPEARACCLRPWSPFDSGTAFKHQLMLFKLNLGRTLMVFISYSPFTLAVGFGALCYCFAPFWPSRRRKNGEPPRLIPGLAEIRSALVEKRRLVPALCLLTMIVYPIPYTLVFSDERFFWPILIVVLGLGLFLLNVFVSQYTVSRKARGWLVGVFAASFLIFPAYKLATGQKDRDSMASIVRQLEGAHLSGARFASNSDYGASMVAGYYLKAKYYGQARPGMSDAEIVEDLQRKGVQYYFVWGAPPVTTPGLQLWRVMKADYRSLAIYQVAS
jgi:hypothetical protein